MSIEFADFTTLVDNTAVAELAAKEKAVTDAVRQVELEHPGYSHSYSTEIRCDAWACSQFMAIKVGKGHNNSAAETFATHRAKHVDALLAKWFPAPENEDLGN
jgi:hypothetical protein